MKKQTFGRIGRILVFTMALGSVACKEAVEACKNMGIDGQTCEDSLGGGGGGNGAGIDNKHGPETPE